MKMILMVVSAAALATAANGKPMVVVEDDTRWTLRVAYDDLNLVSPRGRERLTSRVTAAVRTMCRIDNPNTLVMKLAEQRCYAASIRDASDQIKRALKARSIGIASGPQAIEMVRR